jgi:hypothetical protein
MSQLIPSETSQSGTPDILVFHAASVTGSQEIPVEVGPTTSVGAVADSIALRMALPSDVAWGLRDDDSSAFLDDSRPIGDQIEPGAHVTVIPKTHLGGARA